MIGIGKSPSFSCFITLQQVINIHNTNKPLLIEIPPRQEVYILANDSFALSSPSQQADLLNTELASYSTLPFIRSSDNDGYLNVRDGIRQGDETQTPLQFVYEAVDCRIWYEASMTVDVEVMWERAVDVAWGGRVCVYGDVGLGTGERAKREGRRRNERRGMASEEVKGFGDSVALWTDLRGEKVVGNGYMLP